MQLTDDQKKQIAERLTKGDGIADIQRLINDEFKIHMTYMEVRFLIDDLNLDLAEPEPPKAAQPEEDSPEPKDADAELIDEGGTSNVSVDIDRVKRPGAALSGSVTFSDGVKAQWYLDQYGRLGLEAEKEGYQPSPEDIQEFQVELQNKMQGPM